VTAPKPVVVHIMDGWGHMVMFDDPVTFADTLLAALAALT
jgi:pimeloyl-ACP methyl ester carboxylesterase